MGLATAEVDAVRLTSIESLLQHDMKIACKAIIVLVPFFSGYKG